MISGSWDQALCQAPHSAWSLLKLPGLRPPNLTFSKACLTLRCLLWSVHRTRSHASRACPLIRHPPPPHSRSDLSDVTDCRLSLNPAATLLPEFARPEEHLTPMTTRFSSKTLLCLGSLSAPLASYVLPSLPSSLPPPSLSFLPSLSPFVPPSIPPLLPLLLISAHHLTGIYFQ